MHPSHPAASFPLFDPARRCPAIPDPDAPRWLIRTALIGSLSFEPSGPRLRPVAAAAAVSIATLGSATFLGAPGAIGSFLFLSIGALAMAPLARVGRNRVITTMGDEIDGIPITGEAWSLLRDCAVRFEDAKRMIDQVPTGFEWAEIWPDINVLLWDAAKHAARVSALDMELAELQWAEAGTPQDVFRETLRRRRDDEYEVLRSAQWEAYSLQREAGNAAAAAKLAMLHVGSVDALERAVPSTEAISARIRLAEARGRLQMLTQAWAELDPQHRVLEAGFDAQAALGAGGEMPALEAGEATGDVEHLPGADVRPGSGSVKPRRRRGRRP